MLLKQGSRDERQCSFNALLLFIFEQFYIQVTWQKIIKYQNALIYQQYINRYIMHLYFMSVLQNYFIHYINNLPGLIMSSFISSSSVSSSQSAFHKRGQKFLVSYLNEQFGYDEQLATIIIMLHNCTDLPQTLNLFVKNDNNKYEHAFIANEQNQCKICGQHISDHIFGEDEQIKNSIKEIQNEFFRQKQLNEDMDMELEEELVFSIKRSKKKSQRQNEKGQRFNCQICYISYKKEQMVHINEVLHHICLTCMNSYLQQQISNLRLQRISCPHCYQSLNSQTIQSFVNKVTFQKYQTFLRNLQIQKNPNLRWCPNPKCAVVINFKKGKNTIRCPKCSTQICTKCNREAHPKRSCDSILKKQLQGLENAKDIQKCKKCQALVQKISGCNHMTCTVCQYQWCWLCGSTISDLHFSPFNPFGCAGLQDQHHNSWGKCKIFSLRILIFLGLIILIPIILPLVMIGCGPFILLSHCWREKRINRKGCCTQLFAAILFLILGFILDPFFWIFGIMWSIPQICKLICEWIERRRQIHQYSEGNLKNKLLMEKQIIISQEL